MERTVNDHKHEISVKQKQKKYVLVALYKQSVVIWHARTEKLTAYGVVKQKENAIVLGIQITQSGCFVGSETDLLYELLRVSC